MISGTIAAAFLFAALVPLMNARHEAQKKKHLELESLDLLDSVDSFLDIIPFAKYLRPRTWNLDGYRAMRDAWKEDHTIRSSIRTAGWFALLPALCLALLILN